MKRYRPRAITDRDLNDLCRELVFRRDGYTCARCGKTQTLSEPKRSITVGKLSYTIYRYAGLQWAHIYSRSRKSMQWIPENSICLCAGCHLSWHHRPLEAVAWLEEAFPERAQWLKLCAQTPHKIERLGILLDLARRLSKPASADTRGARVRSASRIPRG